MACNPSPTLTLFGSAASSTVITSFSQSVSSLPNVVTTSQTETCVSTTTGADNLTTCASTSTINQVNTIPGGLTTIQVPIVTTVTTVQTFPTQTLFGSCTSDGNQRTSSTVPTSTPTTQPPSSSSSSSPKPIPTTFRTITTPPPTVVTSRSTATLPNGSAVITTLVVTSSPSPSYVYIPSTVTGITQEDHNTTHSNPKLAPIIGGSVGGSLGLLGLIALVWFIVRRRNAWDDIFDKDNDASTPDLRPARSTRDRTQRMSIDVSSGMEPKPYQYGLIGTASPPLHSPPGSPTGQHPHHDNGQGWIPDYNHNRAYSTDYNQNAQGSGQQHMMHNNGRSYMPDYNQNMQGTSQQHMMHDNGQSYTPNYSQNPQQYLPDHVDTLHQRHPSGTSLLYTPLMLPSAGTRISPEPSMASVYSSTSRPGYSRDSSGSRLPLTAGGSRPSTGGSVGSRPSTGTSIYPNVMAAQMQQQTQRRQRRPSRPDEFGASRPPTAEYGPRPPSASADHANLARRQSSRSRRTSSSGRPTSPRVLTLANWNPGTDNISVDGSPRPPMPSPPEQSRHRVNPSASSTGTVPDTSRLSAAASYSAPQAGPSSRPDNVILHTDGGRVEETSTAPTEDIKEIPAQAPPAYSE